MNSTFTIDKAIATEMQADAATICFICRRLDGLLDADVTLDPQIPIENPQPTPPTPPAEPSRKARIAHFTKLVEQGKPLFPASETDDDDC